jgi:DNA-binding LacI/PurR family transcriptional regulator
LSPRLSDIAKKVGVSEATVSRVLNGRPGVAEATREAVLTALDVLGYERPTQLRGDRGRLVGLVLPELQNPIFPAFAEVVADALAQQGFTPILCTRIVGGISEAEYLELLFQHQVSGVILAGGLYAYDEAFHDHYHELVARRLPTVLVNASFDGLDLPRVSCDDGAAVDQALGHLHDIGHERVGLVIGARDHVPSKRKLSAYLAACHRRHVDELVEHAMFSLEGGDAAATKLLAAGVTGIICGSDVLALGAIRAARRIGRRVPDDVSVIGFDDSALMSCIDPPLTTVRQPIATMGRAAVDLLVSQIQGRATVSAHELLFAPDLVVRNSTAPRNGSGRDNGQEVLRWQQSSTAS